MTNVQNRKANGVYYTPTYVVDYIVRHTLQSVVECRGRDPIRPIRVADPACGAGVFLQQAYQYLLDVHLSWYLERGPQAFWSGMDAKLQRDDGGGWQLTPAERQRILLDCLYGVDIDSHAVEVAKQNLAAIALQRGHGASCSPGESMLRDQLFTKLSANIRCGDALVGPDRSDRPLLDDSTSTSPAAFDWQTEFAPVMRGGNAGFDAVIGNPPYVNIRLLTRSHGSELKDYFRCHYRCARGAYDLYVLFLEKAWQLLRPGGMCGMIVPNKIATLDYAKACRAMMLRDTALHRITDVSQLRVFPGADIYPYILTWQKAKPQKDHRVEVVHVSSANDLVHEPPPQHVRQAALSARDGLRVHGTLDVESRVATEPLGRVAQLHSGTTGFLAQQIADILQERAAIGDAADGEWFPFIVSGNIDRYQIKLGNVRFMKRDFDQPLLPAATNRLTDNKRQLFRSSKIVLAGMTRRLEAALDLGGFALGVQVYAVNYALHDFRYLLALLNSQLLSYLFRIRFQAKQLAGGYLAINKGQLSQLPIRSLELNDPSQRRVYEDLIDLVDRLHDLHAALERQTCAAKRIDVQQQIKNTDREIDAHVFRLYKLTPAEIAQVNASVDSEHSLVKRDAERVE